MLISRFVCCLLSRIGTVDERQSRDDLSPAQSPIDVTHLFSCSSRHLLRRRQCSRADRRSTGLILAGGQLPVPTRSRDNVRSTGTRRL